MKKSKKLLSVLLSLMMIISIIPMSTITASADAYFPTSGTCGESLTWSFDEATRTLTIDGIGEMTNFSSGGHPWEDYENSIISVKIGDYVTTIGSYAFYNCNSLTSITIPNNITTIGYGAFYYCNSLTDITISDSVTTIESFAFSCCESLTSITIPENISRIDSCVFRYCTSLENIKVNSNNQYYSSDEHDVLFNKNKTTLIQYPIGNTRKSYSIPDSVKTIEDNAFSSCTYLTKVSIPDSVTTIGSYTFSDCSNLTSVTLSNSITSIESGTFESCVSLTNITIPDRVTSIGQRSFRFCTNLISITFPSSLTTIDDEAFDDCSSLKYVSIGKQLTNIGNCAFYDCPSLISIEVSADNTVYSSENGILFNKDKTTLIQYPAGKTDMSYATPNNTTTISEHAFYNCSSLANMTIGNSVASIGYGAFADCYSLTSVTIGNSVTTIGDYSFKYCTSLANMTIGNSVTSIGYGAFADCYSLTDVYYSGSEEQWNAISINDYNESLSTATIHFNCTSEHYTETIVNPTCVNPGKTTYICKCGIERIKEFPALGHIYENGICTVCGVSENHTCEFEVIDYKKSTCYEDGFENLICSSCGLLRTNIIPIKHNYKKIAEGQFECIECGNINTKYIELVPNTSHAHVGDIVTVDVNIKNCSELSALTFDVIYDNTAFEIVEYDLYDVFGGGIVNPNYSSNKIRYTGATDSTIGSNNETIVTISFKVLKSVGEIYYTIKEASDYNYKYVDIVNLESIKIGHIYEKSNTKQPTCTEQGYTTYTCECGDSYIDNYIDALGHKSVAVEVISATCQQEGKQYDMCETCGVSLSDIVTIPKTDHTPGNWEIITEATSTADGKKVKKCTVCGTVVKEEIIPATGNDDLGYATDNNTGVSVEFPKSEYDGEVGINVEEVIDDSETIFQLVNSDGNIINSKPYNITMTVNGVETQPNGDVIVKVPLPEGFNPELSLVKHIDLITGDVEDIKSEYIDGYLVFKTNHFSIYVIVEECNYTFSIQSPSRTEIRNKDGVILHANVEGNAPDGSYVRWESSNGNFDKSADGSNLKIVAKNKGWTTFTAILCDADGNELARDSVEMYSKSGFFDKIGGFFRGLFGLTKIYEN